MKIRAYFLYWVYAAFNLAGSFVSLVYCILTSNWFEYPLFILLYIISMVFFSLGASVKRLDKYDEIFTKLDKIEVRLQIFDGFKKDFVNFPVVLKKLRLLENETTDD